VNVQLIDALKDRHLGTAYERTLADSLGLQGELASQIADELRVTLVRMKKRGSGPSQLKTPTAYLVYLEANQIERNPDTLLEDYKKRSSLPESIGLDPKFALAHARWLQSAPRFFIITSRSRAGNQKRVSKPRPHWSCNRISRKRISRSVNAFTDRPELRSALVESIRRCSWRRTTASPQY